MSQEELKAKTGELLDKLLKSVDQNAQHSLQKRMALGEMRGSFATLKDEAAIHGYNDLARILEASAHLSNIVASVDRFESATTTIATSATVGLSLFAGTLGLVATSVGFISSLAKSKQNNQNKLGEFFMKMYEMIMRGFGIVMKRLDYLERKMDYRFDQMEDKMDRQHFTTIMGIIEIIRSGDNLEQYMRREFRETHEELKEIRCDTRAVLSELEEGISLLTSNLNAFRFEKFNELIIMIKYDISKNLMTVEKVHTYLAKLEAAYTTVAKNDHITGTYIRTLSTGEQVKMVKSLSPFELINFVNGIKIAHPAIIKTIRIFYVQLLRMLPYHDEDQDENQELLQQIDEDIENVKKAIITNYVRPGYISRVTNYHVTSFMSSHFEKRKGYLKEEVSSRFGIDMKTSLTFFKQVLNMDLYKFYSEETGKMFIGQGGVESTGYKDNPICKQPFVAYMGFIEEHHKKDCNPRVEWLHHSTPVYGALCYRHGSRRWMNECCGINKRLHDLVMPTAAQSLKPLLEQLEKSRNKNWYWDEMKTNIGGCLNNDFNVDNTLLVLIKYSEYELFFPMKLQNMDLSDLNNVGISPRLEINIDNSMIQYSIYYLDCVNDKTIFESQIYKSVFTKDEKSIFDNKFEKPLEKLMTFLFGGRVIDKFGCTIMHGDAYLGNQYTNEMCYSLPITKYNNGIQRVIATYYKLTNKDQFVTAVQSNESDKLDESCPKEYKQLSDQKELYESCNKIVETIKQELIKIDF